MKIEKVSLLIILICVLVGADSTVARFGSSDLVIPGKHTAVFLRTTIEACSPKKPAGYLLRTRRPAIRPPRGRLDRNGDTVFAANHQRNTRTNLQAISCWPYSFLRIKVFILPCRRCLANAHTAAYHRYNGHLEQAISHLRAAAALTKKNAAPDFLLAYALLVKGDALSAEGALQNAMAKPGWSFYAQETTPCF